MMRRAFWILLEKNCMLSLEDILLSAWCPDGLCFIADDIWWLSPLISLFLLLQSQCQASATVFFVSRVGTGQ